MNIRTGNPKSFMHHLRQCRGAALVEYILVIALFGAISVGTFVFAGPRVQCIFYHATSGDDTGGGPDQCGARAVVSAASHSPATPPITPPPAQVIYTVQFDDAVIDQTEYTSAAITIDGASAGDGVSILISQGATNITLAGVATGSIHRFSNIDLSSFGPGMITVVATVTPLNRSAQQTAPANAMLDLPVVLVPSVLAEGTGFGIEVAMTPTRVFVAAPWHASQVGRVYAYDRATGQELFYIDGDTSRGALRFGETMSAGSDTLAISFVTAAARDFVSIYNHDGVYLYDVDNDISRPNRQRFGRETKISGSTLLVSDQLHSFHVNNMGAVHAFDLNNNGALLWSAASPTSNESGAFFDTDGSIVVSTAGQGNTVSMWSMANGALLRTIQVTNGQNQHIALSNSNIIWGSNPFSVRVWQLTPVWQIGLMSMPLSAFGPRNIYERAGNRVLVNTGNASRVSIVDTTTATVVGTIPFPGTIYNLLPGFGAAMSYEGGDVAIGAPGHSPVPNGLRTGAVFILPMP